MLFEWEGQIYPQAQSCSKEEYEEHGFATYYCQSFPSNFLILIGPSNVPPRRWARILLRYLYLDPRAASFFHHSSPWLTFSNLPTPFYVEAIWIMVLTNHFISHFVEAGLTLILLSPLALFHFTLTTLAVGWACSKRQSQWQSGILNQLSQILINYKDKHLGMNKSDDWTLHRSFQFHLRHVGRLFL